MEAAPALRDFPKEPPLYSPPPGTSHPGQPRKLKSAARAVSEPWVSANGAEHEGRGLEPGQPPATAQDTLWMKGTRLFISGWGRVDFSVFNARLTEAHWSS